MVIIRLGPPYYQLVIDKMSKGIPSQQIFKVDKDISIAEAKTKYAPIFGRFYLVQLSYSKDKSFWQSLRNLIKRDYVRIILFVKTKEDLLTAIAKSEDAKLPIQIYDSYKASRADKELYIKKTLLSYNPDIKITPSNVKLICDRLSGYSSEVNGFIHQLALSPINTTTIQKIIPKRSILTVASFGWLIYDKKISLIEADTFIQQYRFYPMPLIESILKYTEKLLKLYGYYIKGEFTDINYESFVVENKKLITSQYNAKNILLIFERLSMERLYKIYSMLCDVNPYNRFECILVLYKVVRLIGG